MTQFIKAKQTDALSHGITENILIYALNYYHILYSDHFYL